VPTLDETTEPSTTAAQTASEDRKTRRSRPQRRRGSRLADPTELASRDACAAKALAALSANHARHVRLTLCSAPQRGRLGEARSSHQDKPQPRPLAGF
jgi:hypothetical protein